MYAPPPPAPLARPLPRPGSRPPGQQPTHLPLGHGGREEIALPEGAAGGPQLALVVYLVFYATCLALTWWYYLRRGSEVSGVPSLAEARI